MADIPGPARRGNWTVGAVRRREGLDLAVKALTRIFTGRAGGSTALLKILVGSFLGVRQVPISYELEGETRIIKIEKIVDGAITPVRGKDQGERRDPQQRILDRARHHRVARRQDRASARSAATGISPADRRKSAGSTGATEK